MAQILYCVYRMTVFPIDTLMKNISGLLYTFRQIRIPIATLLLILSCDKEDPKPVNEAELVTTVEVTLIPEGIGIPVRLKFFDADGDQGSIVPLYTVSGSLKASTSYVATIKMTNETVNPPGDITQEVEAEANDHLFCFDVNGNLTIAYEDVDGNGFPLGLSTSWLTGDAGQVDVAISLRHQAGTKTGQCPGVGESDVDVAFRLTVE